MGTKCGCRARASSQPAIESIQEQDTDNQRGEERAGRSVQAVCCVEHQYEPECSDAVGPTEVGIGRPFRSTEVDQASKCYQSQECDRLRIPNHVRKTDCSQHCDGVHSTPILEASFKSGSDQGLSLSRQSMAETRWRMC